MAKPEVMGAKPKAGEYLEYFASAGNRLCSNIALANSASFQKGLTVAE